MVYEVGLINVHDLYIYPLLTPVAMAAKFGSKLAITRLAYEISASFFCICGGVIGNGPSNAAN